MGVVLLVAVLVVVVLVFIVCCCRSTAIGPTEVGLVTKRFGSGSSRTTTRSRSTARPGTRPSC